MDALDQSASDVTFELVEMRTSNSIAAFPDEGAALAAFRRLAAQNAESADSLLLVEFDGEGEAVRAWPALSRRY